MADLEKGRQREEGRGGKGRKETQITGDPLGKEGKDW